MGHVIHVADEGAEAAVLTETGSGGLFGGQLLHDAPLETHFYDGECPKYVLFNKKEGVRIERAGTERRLAPDDAHRMLVAVTDVRILFVVGRANGDVVRSVPLVDAQQVAHGASSIDGPAPAAERWELAIRRYQDVLWLDWGRDERRFDGDPEAVRETIVDGVDNLVTERRAAARACREAAHAHQMGGHPTAARDAYRTALCHLDRAAAVVGEVAPNRETGLEDTSAAIEDELDAVPDESGAPGESVDSRPANGRPADDPEWWAQVANYWTAHDWTVEREDGDLLDYCAERGVTLMEAFMYRFHPRTERALEILVEELGEIRHVGAAFTFALGDNPEDIRLDPELAGGALMDVGCYTVSAALQFLGEPERAYAHAVDTYDSGVDSQLAGTLEYADGVTAHVTGGFDTPNVEQYRVLTTDGWLQATDAFGPGPDQAVSLTWAVDGEERTETFDAVDHYRLEVEGFAEAIEAG